MKNINQKERASDDDEEILPLPDKHFIIFQVRRTIGGPLESKKKDGKQKVFNFKLFLLTENDERKKLCLSFTFTMHR